MADAGIKQNVNGKLEENLASTNEEFIYSISFDVPVNVNELTKMEVKDTFDANLAPNWTSAKVYVNEVEDTSLKGNLKNSGNELSFTIDKGFLSSLFGSAFEGYAGKTIRIEIPTTLTDAYVAANTGKPIENTATLRVNDQVDDTGAPILKTSDTVTVNPPQGDVILTKLVNGEDLSGTQEASFELYRKVGQVDSAENAETDDTLLPYSDTVDAYAVNAANNQIVVNGLEPGDYYFKEISEPDGYILDETPKEFSVSLDQEDPIALTVNNVQELTPIKTVDHTNAITVGNPDQVFT